MLIIIHPTKKKCFHPKIDFFDLIISLSFLEFEWKISYRWEANIINFFMVQKLFLYFEDFLSYEFFEQKYHFCSSNQKNFSFVETLSCIDYFAKKLLSKIAFIN